MEEISVIGMDLKVVTILHKIMTNSHKLSFCNLNVTVIHVNYVYCVLVIIYPLLLFLLSQGTWSVD